VSGQYRTIVADPPWEYDAFANNPKPGLGGTKAIPYPTMTLEEIAAIPVRTFAASDARLFLWTTNKYLPDAFDIARLWGFRYAQTVVWHKTGNPSPFGGSIAPNHAEFLLVARRGVPPISQRWHSNVIAANVQDHSAKPDAFLDVVEVVSPGPYLEMFARRQRLGWDTWGNEALGHVEIAS
jgi:N6-adenosine-specific RNA methylase IME4